MHANWFWPGALLLALAPRGENGPKKGDEPPPRNGTFLKTLELESSTPLSLAVPTPAGKRVVVLRTGQGTREIPVELTQRIYWYVTIRVEDGKLGDFEPGGLLYCYELRSTSPSQPFAWSCWSLQACGCFALFQDEQRGTHLALVEGCDVLLARIDGPRDALATLPGFLQEQRTPSGFTHVPVQKLIPRAAFYGKNALYQDDIRIVDLSVAPSRITTTVKSQHTGKAFRLQFDGKAWKCEEGK